MLEVLASGVEVIGQQRAPRADVVRIRREHVVIDEELAAAGEQLRQGLRPVAGLEDILFLDLHPGQGAAFGAHLIQHAGGGLFLLEERFAGLQPGGLGDDLRGIHAGLRCEVGS